MATTIYDPIVNSNPLTSGFLAYGQLPVSPAYPFPPSLSAQDVFTPIPSLLDSATAADRGITLDTDGRVFDGIPGYEPIPYFLSNGQTLIPTGRTLSATANTGYAGFTNYTIDFDNIDFNDIEGSLNLEPVNPAFPILDANVGFTLAFDLTILEESSQANRAGFSLLVVTNDVSREIELGFKTAGADRIFAQQANFVEGENSSATPLDLSITQTYWLNVSGNTYSLEVEGVEVLSGNLRNYNFDPTTSEPPLPAAANPYDTPNLIFFGDNTDQAHAQFTLGQIRVLPLQDDPNFNADPVLFNYEQFLRYQNPNASVPTDTISGLKIAQFFDENYYLSKNSDVAASVATGALASGFQHFMAFGLAEGRDPSVLYDEAFYLANNPDIAQAVNNNLLTSGLVHFVNFGHGENRDPSRLFDQEDYLTNNPDVAAAVNNGVFQSAFEHYIESGLGENRLPALSLYNEAFYLQNNPDIAAAVTNGSLADGFAHFVSFGQQEGRAPSTLYNEASYRALNPDVDAAVAAGTLKSGFHHYEQFGRFEGRQALAN